MIRRARCRIHGHNWGFWQIHPSADLVNAQLRVCQRCGEREIKSLPGLTLEILAAAVDKTRADYREGLKRPLGERFDR